MRFVASSSTLALAVAFGLAACASASNDPPSTREQAASGALSPQMLQWTGKFRQGEQQTSNVEMHGRNTSVGDVRLTADGANVIRAQITFSLDVLPAITGAYRWSLASGECGTDSFPVIPVNEFPLLPIANNRGTLDGVVSYPLPTTGRYHVNVFQTSGADQGDVMGCADLTLGRRGADR